MKKNIFFLTLAIIYSCQLLTAQNFITQWNLATAGSGAAQLTIGTETSGTANYTWQQVPTGASGSGSWSGATLNITGLPAGATIRLQITPANFRRIAILFGADRNRLTQVEVWGSTAWTSMAGAFYGCTNLQVTATDVPDLSGVNSMAGMFYGCTNLNSPANINAWNTVAVTDMSNMFRGASAFNQNIGLWNTAAVTNMAFMFYEASAFNNGGNNSIANWNTGAVTDIIYMFKGASAFNQNIGSWNTTAVTDMQGMFQEASAFNNGGSGSINNWNTAAVTNMFLMFQSASAFNQNISSWNTSAVTDLSYMFQGASAFNQNIGSWNTAAVTNMALMFNSASAFNQNIGSLNTAAVTDMNNMFNGASAFNQNIGTWTLNPAVDLSGLLDNSGLDCNHYSAILIGWNANPSTPTGRNLGAAGRQYGTNAAAARTNLTGAKGWTITGDAPSGFSCVPINSNDFVTVWNLAAVPAPHTQISFGVATIGTVNYTWETIPPAATGSGNFTGSTATITGLPANATIRLSIQPANFERINIDNGADRFGLIEVEQWGSTAWTNMQTAFRGCVNLQVTATDVPDLSGVSDMSQMFDGCTNLNSPGNINTWNTAAVSNMQQLFQLASSFNQNIANWNTSAVTNMFYMFSQASAFNQNIDPWNTAAVTDVQGMFFGAGSFNQYIGSWNTAAVTNMNNMFSGATAFNQNIGSWNTAAVNNMNNMFNGASAFNQNIGLWTLNPGVDLSNLLDNSGMDCNHYSATLIGWNANPSTPNGRNLGATGRQYGTNAVAARTNLTGAKGWIITGDTQSGNSCPVILPVTWLYVNGQLQNGNTIIKWATASERNTHTFEIEYSTNGINYSKIGNVATASNSNITQRYEFLHTSPAIGKNYYRIKQIDLDGRFTYSAVIVLDNLFKKNVLISPNPVQQSTTVYFKEPGRKTIRLLNANGQLILEEQVQQGNNRYNLNMGNLPAGIFMLQVQKGNEKEVHKIIKQ